MLWRNQRTFSPKYKVTWLWECLSASQLSREKTMNVRIACPGLVTAKYFFSPKSGVVEGQTWSIHRYSWKVTLTEINIWLYNHILYMQDVANTECFSFQTQKFKAMSVGIKIVGNLVELIYWYQLAAMLFKCMWQCMNVPTAKTKTKT